MVPTYGGPFARDVVIINTWAIILWTLTLISALSSVIIKVLKLKRGQTSLGKRNLKGLSNTRRTWSLPTQEGEIVTSKTFIHMTQVYWSPASCQTLCWAVGGQRWRLSFPTAWELCLWWKRLTITVSARLTSSITVLLNGYCGKPNEEQGGHQAEE